MRRFTFVIGTLIVIAVAATAVVRLTARQQLPDNPPGHPTQARVFVINQERQDAIPVSVVESTGLLLDARSTVGTRAMAQPWEYRSIVVRAGQDLTGVLNAAGAEGWEAVSASIEANTTVVLMKKPK